ncbi:hypothetical protein [Kribbella karoonensis]|uniref:MYXO-CTERM domain-containing protein n=1 Tax=Kribbella karoonensis TaxID=324851 RepID=A0ABN2CW86_9ACTN
MRRPQNILLRCAAVLAAGLGFTFAAAGLAGAAGPQPVAPNELSKATTAARSETALSLLEKAGGTAKARPTVAQDTHPIYALNPAFVRDATAPVATFWYAATSASAGGKPVTVYTTPDGHGSWQAVNVASGNTESRMVAAAKGATLFTEPQLGAWYALTATQVRPLNPSAVKSIGSKPIAITAYQDLVSHRYSDKLPGSKYNDQGVAGGYDAGYQDSVAAEGHSPVVPIALAGGVLAGGVLLVVRRRLKVH